MPIASPRLCPVLVERETEQAVLADLLAEAAAGRGRLAVLSGEAGSGKSRLAAEAQRTAVARGFETLLGSCAEHDRDYPFAPVLDALRQWLSQDGADPTVLLGDDERGAHRAALVGLLPELERGESTTAALLPPEPEKRRRFEAIVALLARLAARRPVLLILEDAHWADPTTLELLPLLARRLAAARVLVLVTARSNESGDRLGWDHCLTDLRRRRQIVELVIEPLTRPGTARMLEAMFPAAPSPALVNAVHARTGGNPFFIEELVATAPSGEPGRATAWLLHEPVVPKTVRDVVLCQLDDLDTGVRALVDAAAVAGPECSFDLLVAVSGRTADEVAEALAVLVERQLMVETRRGGETRYAFRHALARDAVRDCLLSQRRRALHRAVGMALANQRAAGRPISDADLGYHFHAAESWDEALLYATKAAEAAAAGHATAEALAHDRRALDAALALGDSQAAALHRRCGRALTLLGMHDPARIELEAALRLAREHEDRALEVDALLDLAALHASHDYRLAERQAAAALALARELGDRRREGQALNRLGNVLTNLTRFVDGRALHEEAEAIFAELGDTWGAADAQDLIGMARYLAGEVPEARAAFARAADAFAKLGDPARLASALTSRGLYLAVLDGPCATDAPPSAFRADAHEGLRRCREIDWRAGEVYALVALASADVGAGRYRDAGRRLDEALAIAQEIGHRQWVVIASLTRGLLRVELLDDAGAEAAFAAGLAIAEEIGAAQWVERLSVWVARCQLRLGSPADGQAVLRSIAPPDSTHPGSIGQRRALCSLAEFELAAGRPEIALDLIERLLGGASDHRPAAAILLRAEILAALDRTDEADRTLLDARNVAAALGPRGVVWRVAAARSRLWKERGRRLAEAEAETARRELATLADPSIDEAALAALLTVPEAHPWLGAGGRRRTAIGTGPAGLTPRELEVVHLVAAGRSNREIAEALSISVPTVKRHLTTVLAKLDLPSRSALNTYAHVHGLA